MVGDPSIGGSRDPKPLREVVRGRWETVPQRWASKVTPIDDPDSCWEWEGGRQPEGYGLFSHARAHRVAYYLATGVDPVGYDVCHRCDNPPCVRPTHLFLGNQADNNRDMAAKGRVVGFAKKVTDDQVEQIRLLYSEGRLYLREIAPMFEISHAQAARIVRGDSRSASPVLIDWRSKGFRTRGTVLTDEQVAEIRSRYAAGGVTQRALAAQYGVGQPHISYIVRGLERKDVA